MPARNSYDHRTTNPLHHIVWGIRFFFAGLRLLLRQPALLGLSLIPILLTVVLLVALAFGGWWLAGRIVADTFADDQGGVGALLRPMAQTLVFLLVLALGYFLYLPLARVLLAPFAEILSRRTSAITGAVNRQNHFGWARASWEGLKLVLFQLTIALAALALGLAFPPVGAPVGITVAIFLCGLDFCDVPLSTRGLPLRRKLGVIWRHKTLALGFGLAGYVMLLIPLVNLLSLPVGVIGATLLIDALERDSANGF